MFLTGLIIIELLVFSLVLIGMNWYFFRSKCKKCRKEMCVTCTCKTCPRGVAREKELEGND